MRLSRDYKPKHAAAMSAAVAVGGCVWIGYCIHLSLPFHPWSSTAIAAVAATTLLLFAGLDPLGGQLVHSLHGAWSMLALICIAAATIFTPTGAAFPLWALIPLIMLGAAFACITLFFGLRSMIRVVRDLPVRSDAFSE